MNNPFCTAHYFTVHTINNIDNLRIKENKLLFELFLLAKLTDIMCIRMLLIDQYRIKNVEGGINLV